MTEAPEPRSEYDELFPRASGDAPEAIEAEGVRHAFRRAARPYLSSPVSWLVWSVALPAAALLTPVFRRAGREAGVVLLWSGAVLIGGAVEGALILRARRGRADSPLGAWAMRSQGNLSLVAVLLSAVLLWLGAPELLPGLWLLLLGHSLFSLGGLAFPPMRHAGLLYQLGGLLALVPGSRPLWAFAAATFLGNLRIALGIIAARRRPAS